MTAKTTTIGFDQLYASVCDKLRDTNETSKVLEQIANCPSDYDCIILILKSDPNIVEIFVKNITNCYESKNETKANESLITACSRNSVELINEALRFCYNDNPEKISHHLTNITDIKKPENLQIFIQAKLNPSSVSVPSSRNLIAEVFSRRSAILFHNGKFDSCIRDTFRSLKYGMIKSYDYVLRLGLSYKHLGFYNEAKLVSQHALDVLRKSSLDNEAKSKETIRLVAIIKEILQLESSGTSGISKSSPSTANMKEKAPGKCLKSKSGKLPLIFEDKYHENISGISCALELKYTEERGRHIIARKTIPPGSTIIMETPYSWSVSLKNYPFICQYCLRSEPASLDGIPCPNCSSVIFCNEECLERSMTLFHKYECQILKLLDSSDKLGKMGLLAFRTIVQTPHQALLNQFQNASNNQNPSNSSTLGFNQEGKFISSDYASVYAQTTNSSLRNPSDLLKRTYASIYLTICLRHTGYLKNFPSSLIQNEENEDENALYSFSDSEKIVAAVLLRHLQSVSCNAYGINQVTHSESSKCLEIEEIGGASYPIISTTNHSCNPNAYRFNIGKTCVVTTLQEIAEGTEVFDSYGPLFTISNRSQRQQELETQYLFQCNCNACLNNWPCFDILKSSEYKNDYKCPICQIGNLDTASGKDKRKCSNCSKLVEFKKIQKLLKTAEDKYSRAKSMILKQKLDASDILKSICNYILTIQKVMILPCKEMVEAQEVLKLYWNLSVKNGILRPELE